MSMQMKAASADAARCTSASIITLEEGDIEPGAILEEPLEATTIPQLRWWLLCHGCVAPTNERKPGLIARVRKAKSDDTKVCDVDGTYLERSGRKLIAVNVPVAPLPCPVLPLCGWKPVEENREEIAQEMPVILPTTLYTYLAEGVGNAKGSKAFRALKRGYVHWASGRLTKLEVQTRHPNYTFVRCQIGYHP